MVDADAVYRALGSLIAQQVRRHGTQPARMLAALFLLQRTPSAIDVLAVAIEGTVGDAERALAAVAPQLPHDVRLVRVGARPARFHLVCLP